MEKVFKWTLENGSTADALLIDGSTNLSIGLGRIGLYPPRPAIVIVGGASGISPSDLEDLRLLFTDELAPLAESLRAVVIDGGTNTGVMRLIGQARRKHHSTFPLIGVLPAGKVSLPHLPPPVKVASLEPHHTHFIFAPGSQWGDESYWLAHVASTLARSVPSVTILANGGDIAWQDVSESVRLGRPVIVIAGSGRTADILAEALHGRSHDTRARELVASGLLRAVDFKAGSGALAQAIREIFATE